MSFLRLSCIKTLTSVTFEDSSNKFPLCNYLYFYSYTVVRTEIRKGGDLSGMVSVFVLRFILYNQDFKRLNDFQL